VSRAINGPGSATTLVLESATGFAANDLVLVSQSGVTGLPDEEVGTITAPTLNVADDLLYGDGTATTLATSPQHLDLCHPPG